MLQYICFTASKNWLKKIKPTGPTRKQPQRQCRSRKTVEADTGRARVKGGGMLWKGRWQQLREGRREGKKGGSRAGAESPGICPSGTWPSATTHPNQAEKGWLLLLHGSVPGVWGTIISLGQEKCPFPVYLCVLSPEGDKRL